MINFPAIDIAASGLSAERFRMEGTANNIANANTTMTENGEPYRRQAVVFSSLADPLFGSSDNEEMLGVKVMGVQSDPTEFPTIYQPGHPHADADGFVKLTNVRIPDEMVDMITATRAYEANTRAISAFKEMVEQTLSLLQGGR